MAEVRRGYGGGLTAAEHDFSGERWTETVARLFHARLFHARLRAIFRR